VAHSNPVVGIFADLVRRVSQWVMLKLPTGRGFRGLCPGGYDLRARRRDDPVRLRNATAAGVARRLENIRALRIIQDGGAAVVATVALVLVNVNVPF
jgi:hypothetical protein